MVRWTVIAAETFFFSMPPHVLSDFVVSVPRSGVLLYTVLWPSSGMNFETSRWDN